MKPVRKIDIHAHATAFPESFPPHWITNQRMLSGPELLEIYDRLDIEMGVLLSLAAVEGNCAPLTSEATKHVADANPDRFVWFCGVDPRSGMNAPDGDLSWFLRHYKNLGAKGVGELTANLYADDPWVENLFAHAAALQMPVTIHISPKLRYNYGIVDEIGLPRLEKMLKKYPELKILGHSQPFWAEMSADLEDVIDQRNGYPQGKVIPGRLVELMREYGNLYCDLSAGSGMNALRRDPEHAARFIEEFSDRILYGCDICAAGNTHQYAFDAFLKQMLADGQLSVENYAKVVRNNAIDLLDLPLEKA